MGKSFPSLSLTTQSQGLLFPRVCERERRVVRRIVPQGEIKPMERGKNNESRSPSHFPDPYWDLSLSLLSPRSLLYGDPWATCSRARSLLSLLLLSQCKLLSLPYTSDPFTPANSKLELIAIALSGQATLPLSLRTFIQKGDLSFSLLLLPWDDTNR